MPRVGGLVTRSPEVVKKASGYFIDLSRTLSIRLGITIKEEGEGGGSKGRGGGEDPAA